MVDIYNELLTYGIRPIIADAMADKNETKRLYNIELEELNAVADMDALVIAVEHEAYKNMTLEAFDRLYKIDGGKKILFDLKGIFDKRDCENAGFDYWRL